MRGNFSSVSKEDALISCVFGFCVVVTLIEGQFLARIDISLSIRELSIGPVDLAILLSAFSLTYVLYRKLQRMRQTECNWCASLLLLVVVSFPILVLASAALVAFRLGTAEAAGAFRGLLWAALVLGLGVLLSAQGRALVRLILIAFAVQAALLLIIGLALFGFAAGNADFGFAGEATFYLSRPIGSSVAVALVAGIAISALNVPNRSVFTRVLLPFMTLAVIFSQYRSIWIAAIAVLVVCLAITRARSEDQRRYIPIALATAVIASVPVLTLISPTLTLLPPYGHPSAIVNQIDTSIPKTSEILADGSIPKTSEILADGSMRWRLETWVTQVESTSSPEGFVGGLLLTDLHPETPHPIGAHNVFVSFFTLWGVPGIILLVAAFAWLLKPGMYHSRDADFIAMSLGFFVFGFFFGWAAWMLLPLGIVISLRLHRSLNTNESRNKACAAFFE